MIVVRYAVCSEREQKPLTRAVVDNRAEAERLVERYRREDGHDSETAYWIAELGPEAEAWRWLARKSDKSDKSGKVSKNERAIKVDKPDSAEAPPTIDNSDENDQSDDGDDRGEEAAAPE